MNKNITQESEINSYIPEREQIEINFIKKIDEDNKNLEKKISNIIAKDIDTVTVTKELPSEEKQSLQETIKGELSSFPNKLINKKDRQKILTGTMAMAATIGLLGVSVANRNEVDASTGERYKQLNTPVATLVQETQFAQESDQNELAPDPKPTEQIFSPKQTEEPEIVELNLDLNREDKEETNRIPDLSYLLDLSKNSEFKLVNKINEEFVIRSKAETQLILVPIQKDLFIDQNESIKIIGLKEDSLLTIKEVRLIENNEKEVFQIGVVSGNYGAQVLPLVVLSSGEYQFDINNLDFAEHDPSVVSSISYIVGKNNVYPNKIINDLQALINITKLQKQNGPLNPGEQYSAIELLSLDNINSVDYKLGKTSTGYLVKAGGVCSVVTGISSLLYKTFPEIVPQEQWHHPSKYFQGPFSMDEKIVDATVQTPPDGKFYDFRWEQPGNEPLYFHINVSLVANGAQSESEYKTSDVDMVMTIGFSPNPPSENQVSKLMENLTKYQNFREQNTSSSITDSEYRLFDSINYEKFIESVYNPKNIELFATEQKALVDEVLKLKNVVNNIPADEKVSVHIKNSEWYKNWIEKQNDEKTTERLEDVLRTLNQADFIENQRVQCVGFSVLVGVVFPELNIQHIGGAHISFAKELIPKAILNGGTVSSTGFGGVAFGNLNIEDFETGDLFVRPDGNAGHVGVILSKIIVNGQSVLLVTDANRNNDGLMNIFMVDDHNFFEVFGDQISLIRSNNSIQLLNNSEKITNNSKNLSFHPPNNLK